eukprot:532486_1
MADTKQKHMIIDWHIRQQNITLFPDTICHLIFLFFNSPSYCCFGIGKNDYSELSPIEEENQIDIHRAWTWLDDFNDRITDYHDVYLSSHKDKILLYNRKDHKIYIKGCNLNGECSLGFKSHCVPNFISLESKCKALNSDLIASSNQVLIAPYKNHFIILLKFKKKTNLNLFTYKLFIPHDDIIAECNEDQLLDMIPVDKNIIKIERIYKAVLFWCDDNTLSIYRDNELKYECKIQEVLWAKDWMNLYKKAPNGKVKMIKNGTYHTCVLYENGDCYIFGSNDDGQIGRHKNAANRRQDRFFKICRFQSSFDEFRDTKIIDVSLGHEHTVLISEKNEIIAFGSNSYSQCGEICYDNIGYPHIVSKVNDMGFESEDAHIYRVIAGYHITIVFTDSKHLEFEYITDSEDCT